jgi:hypothetical protein
VFKTFGDWYQKTNKTEDTNKLTLLAFKIVTILHNTRLATFIKFCKLSAKASLGIDSRTAFTHTLLDCRRTAAIQQRVCDGFDNQISVINSATNILSTQFTALHRSVSHLVCTANTDGGNSGTGISLLFQRLLRFHPTASAIIFFSQFCDFYDHKSPSLSDMLCRSVQTPFTPL